jgi:hypothetical protein
MVVGSMSSSGLCGDCDRVFVCVSIVEMHMHILSICPVVKAISTQSSLLIFTRLY